MTDTKRRICTLCHQPHNTFIENTETGEVVEYLDTCKDCLMSSFPLIYKPVHIQVELVAESADEQPLVDQMAALYNHCVKTMYEKTQITDAKN